VDYGRPDNEKDRRLLKLATTFDDRLKAQQEAKKALLAKFKPKPMVTASEPPADRELKRRQELEALRAQRQAEKEARARARAEAEEKARLEREAAEAAMRAEKKAQIKERRSLEKMTAAERRASKLAAYAQYKTAKAQGLIYDFDD
jgi:hypothetical protein